MSQFAIDLNRDDHAAAERLLECVTDWKRPPGRNYWTGEATHLTDEHPLLQGCSRAFFIKIPPRTDVYRHRDPRVIAEKFDTDHIVVKTNSRACNCWQDEDGIERSQHLELGHRYRVVDRGLLHWAYNDGDTDRVHLLIEYPKSV